MSFSTPVSLFLILSAAWSSVDGLNLPFERRAPRGGSMTSPRSGSRYHFGGNTDKEASPIGNVKNIRYTSNITINGVEVHVALDTGSTDLWVSPPNGLGTVNDTGIPLSLLYGDGTYGVKGTIAVAPFEFGSYEIERQAFLDVKENSLGGSLSDLKIDGLLGLSFDVDRASPINQAIKSKYGPSADWGKSVLKSIFDQSPSKPNFIAFDLARTDDLEDTQGGSFGIGEYDPKWAAIANSPKLPQFPEGGSRWTTLLEGISVDGTSIPVVSTIKGVPSGKAITLLDTGDPSSVFPVAIFDAIYSHIPGAVKYAAESVWILPCNTTASLALSFGGQEFPFHPLDLSILTDTIQLPDGSEAVACVSSFKGIDNWAPDDFDISLGDTFLRNVYAAFDFGDTTTGGTGSPYMQLLNEIDPVKAAAQVKTIRGETMASMPPEIAPADLLELLGGSNESPGLSTIASPTKAAAAVAESSTSKSSVDASIGGAHVSVNIDDEVKRYGLIAIGLLAANLLIGLVLIGFGIMSCIRRGSARKSSREVVTAAAPQYVPVKLQEEGGYSGYRDHPQKYYGQ